MNQIRLTKNILLVSTLDQYNNRSQVLSPFKSSLYSNIDLKSELEYIATNPKKCKLYKDVQEFMVGYLVKLFEERLWLEPTSYLNSHLNTLVKGYSTRELISCLINEVEDYKMGNIVYFYTPQKLNAANRSNIRSKIGKNRLTVFIYKPDLIGGAQVLINSKLTDYSWATKISLIDNYAK